MKKLAVLSFCVSCMFASIASAETIFIPGSAGVADQANATCSDREIPTGKMGVAPLGPQCMIAYPLNVPAGKIIDGVEVSYSNSSGQLNNSIVAYLAQNRVKPNLGPIAIAGASAKPAPGSAGFLNMSALNIPLASGSVYWVQIFDQGVTYVDYVSVTYH